MNHSQITSFIWSVADLIRDTFKRGKYQPVILPLTVLRRIDQVLAPTNEKVLETYGEYKASSTTGTTSSARPPPTRLQHLPVHLRAAGG